MDGGGDSQSERGEMSLVNAIQAGPQAKPRLKHLMRLNTGNWLNLGLELDLSYDKLKEIEKNYPRDDGSCKREMFHLWLKSCPSASYQRLAEAYEKAGEEDMADMIRQNMHQIGQGRWTQSHTRMHHRQGQVPFAPQYHPHHVPAGFLPMGNGIGSEQTHRLLFDMEQRLTQQREEQSLRLKQDLQLMVVQKDQKDQENMIQICGLIGDMHRKVEELSLKMNAFHSGLPVGSDELYEMDCIPHGICLIINNHRFYHPTNPEKAHPERIGSEVDCHNLVETFRYLGYRVEVAENLSSVEMKQRLREMSEVDHSRYDSFLCCILTCGEENVCYGADSLALDISDLTGPIKECSSLVNKPKMYFIQACRGENSDEGVCNVGDVAYSLSANSLVQSDGPIGDRARAIIPLLPLPSLVPKDADFFLGYATPSGRAAYRSRRTGSWFISELCQVFTEFARTHTLTSMMRKVNARVCQKHVANPDLNQSAASVDGCTSMRHLKQCIESVDRLRKDVHFFYRVRFTEPSYVPVMPD